MGLERIGTPLAAVKLATAVYAKEADGYRIYTVAQGEPCRLYVIDAVEGKCLASHELIGSNHSWGMCRQQDGAVYIGGDGYLYRYDPAEDELENCGEAIAGETYFWRITAGDDGKVYGGTYPGGKVFGYDPAARTFRDYGEMVPGEKYARSIAAGPTNKLYVGMGTQRAAIVELDAMTGDKRTLPTPEGQEACKIVYDLDVAGGKLFARYTDTLDLMVYDLEQERWVARIDQAMGLDISPPSADGKVYFMRDSRLHSYNLMTLELMPTPFTSEQHACDFGWIELKGEPDFPGQSLISIRSHGDYWIYNPATQQSKHIQVELRGVPVKIQSLAVGEDGQVHIGGYFAGGFATYDPEADKLSTCRVFGQPEGLHWHAGKLYQGVYPGARIYEYDPAQPWELSSNPREVFSLKPEGQDRPFAMTTAGEHLAIGTVPTYGKLGGALTFYDAATGTYEVHDDIVHAQSVITLCYLGGLLYGGTSVYGGLGIAPTETDGKLFIWDMQSHQKVWEGVPVPGERVISALAPDADGTIWGLTSGHLFRFDPAKREFLNVVNLFEPLNWDETSHFWRGCYLDYDPMEGCLYGNALGKLFRYDPETEQLTLLATDVLLFSRDKRGDIYTARDTELYRYRTNSKVKTTND